MRPRWCQSDVSFAEKIRYFLHTFRNKLCLLFKCRAIAAAFAKKQKNIMHADQLHRISFVKE